MTEPAAKKKTARKKIPRSDRRRSRERAAKKVRTARAKSIRDNPELAADFPSAPEGTPAKLRGVMHPAMIAGRFKPGQSGNPAGRPLVPTLEEIMRRQLGEIIETDNGDRMTKLEAMGRIVFTEGITKKNPKVMIALMDRLWPKPLKIIGDADQPVAIEQVVRRIIKAE